MHNSYSTINIRSKKNNFNQELNNKLALQCSYLINEIKRKNTTLLLPIHISNKKIYLHNKLLTNKKSFSFIKTKDNIRKIISRNVEKKFFSQNVSKNRISQNKISIIKSNNSQKEKMSNSSNNIPLTSLYNLPKMKKEKNSHIRNIIIVNKTNRNNKINKSVTQEKNDTDKNNSKIKNGLSHVENYMKEKFFVDTENKLKNKILTKYFRNDGTIKDKIIYMKKFGIFWKGFIQYCTPIISLQKYKVNFDKNKNQNELNNNNRYIYRNARKINYNKAKSLSLPKIDSKSKDNCK